MALLTADHNGQMNSKCSTDLNDIDWLVRSDFSELGEYNGCAEIKGVPGSVCTICVGFFHLIEDEEDIWFAASSRPRIIGSGSSKKEALTEWVSMLNEVRRLSSSLAVPMGPATENDKECLDRFFGP